MIRQPMMFSKRGTSATDVQAAIAAAAVDLFPFIQTIDPAHSGMSVAAFTANDLRLTRLPRLSAAKQTTNVTIFVGTSSGNIDLSVFSSADNAATMTRVAQTGSVALSGTNTAFTTALTVNWQAGLDYWAGIAINNATATIGRSAASITGAGNAVVDRTKRGLTAGTNFPAPATVAGPTVFGSLYWVMFD